MKQVNENIKSILALYIIGFCLFAIVFMGLPDTTNNQLVNLMLLVIGYYFGASSGSARKDDTIADMARKETPEVGVIKEVIVENITEVK